MTERDRYGPTPLTEAHALAVVVDERIRELLGYRRWYRHNRWAVWTDLRLEHEIELRALVRVARRARRVAAMAYDPMTQAKAWEAQGWSEPELREAFGR
jgi:hypothetical protein